MVNVSEITLYVEQENVSDVEAAVKRDYLLALISLMLSCYDDHVIEYHFSVHTF